jgi:hypothetical protein
VITWLIEGGVGPALVSLPVNWTAAEIASAAKRWFRRLRRTDDLSRLLRAAMATSADLSHAEFAAVRRLLEDQQTWSLAGRGTVEDLAIRIATCLPPRDGRTAGEGHTAARIIARGLLEFTVADLDPKTFQQVLLARLQRVGTDQAGALDEAMLRLHADLVAGFTDVMAQVRQMMDRLPPGQAHRLDIEVYLNALIGWVSSDPWPRDQRFRGPVLTPAAIERKLRITAMGRAGMRDLEADHLAQQCRRLVMLGGPGSGKTWLARRTVRRCAEAALKALAVGGSLDEVELPLYTTCSRLFGADGGIREAVVSSALDQLGDLGSSRLNAALQTFFTERNAPTLLVIDSLDEARGSQERLTQASTLPWRIVLTSRPSSWNYQLAIDDTDDSHRVGEIQPLRYPEDVEPFIHRWFAHQPGWGDDLVAQIARRPGLQQAATVPLVLAFYCIVGGHDPLPIFRRDLYIKVVNRMLTGRWRGSDDRRPDVDVCLQTLRAWAWPTAEANHPVSGVGTWADDIPTERVRLGEADQDALDHIAMPLGPPDVDTGKTLRRFIHRSIREHLVAEHVAGLPVDQAAQVLLPHLWYDPDWEYSAPAALAMHPQHDQLLRDLICRAARSDQIPGDLSAIDAGWEFRGLLARVVAESGEADWSPELAGLIGQTRVDFARSSRVDGLDEARSWGISNRQVRDALVGVLADPAKAWAAQQLAAAVVQLAATAEDKRHAREALLRLLPGQGRGDDAGRLVSAVVGAVVQLAATAQDKRHARHELLGLLSGQKDSRVADELVGGVIQLHPTTEDTRQAREALLRLLAREANRSEAARLAGRVVELAATAEDKRQARDTLLRLLRSEIYGSVAEELAGATTRPGPAADGKRHARDALRALLARGTDGRTAAGLAAGMIQAGLTAEDKRQARGALLGLLACETDGRTAAELASGLSRLDPAAEDKRQACGALLELLAGQIGGNEAVWLVGGVLQLGPAAEDKRQACGALLRCLASQKGGTLAARLANRVSRLDPAAEDERQACGALLGLLADETDCSLAARLVGGVLQLGPAADDIRRARAALLGLLARESDGSLAAELADRVLQLDPTVEDKRRARDALLGLLARESDGLLAARLAEWVNQLDPTAEDKRQAREGLLRLLAHQTYGSLAAGLLDRVVQLAAMAEDKHHARDALLGMLGTGQVSGYEAAGLIGGIVQLATTAEEEKRQAREALLGLLPSQTDGWVTAELINGVVQLGPTAEDKRYGRDELLGMLARETDGSLAARLVDGVIQLDPTVGDLSTWRIWQAPPTIELLAATRRNSALADWLAVLPSLAPLSS